VTPPLQANRKVREGAGHPDRDAQFRHIDEQDQSFQASGDPVISVDTKEKELVGDFKNGGREWRPPGDSEEVRVHDFAISELGRVNPYGVYDVRWWTTMGRPAYPHVQRLLITADGGGSNGSRVRLWKVELQKLADDTGLAISVYHLPPGTSKWNKIEHCLFSFISQN
jgi:hypothetical protein